MLLRPRRLLPAVAAALAALVLGGCSGSSGETEAPYVTPTGTPTPSSTVNVPEGVELTEQGSDLTFGEPARVIFETTQGRGTVLALQVDKVQRGTLADFKGFILDDEYKKKAAYYYAQVRVTNVGEGDVGGVPVPLWGVNETNTLLPAVNFTTGFKRCPSRALPAKFGPGATLRTCLVYLAPERGTLEAVSYRPSQEYNPITWTGKIQPPSKQPKPKKKQRG